LRRLEQWGGWGNVLPSVASTTDTTAPQPQRQLERDVRLAVLTYCNLALAEGLSRQTIAAGLELPTRTLRFWEQRRRQDALAARRRGRPVRRSEPEARQAVRAFLEEVGPGIGLPSVQAHFGRWRRVELRELLAGYRREWQAEHGQTVSVLHWHRPGSVWAIDFTEAPWPIDDWWPYLLAVRDLASGQQLLWLPAADLTSATAVAALARLYREHGAPVVLKADNGSAFRARDFQEQAAAWGVSLLYSPPWRPQYNGAIEAGIGALQTRTYWQAARHGDPQRWSSVDVAEARRQANELARPRGARGPSPAQVWEQRERLRLEEREAFLDDVAEWTAAARHRAGIAPEQELEHDEAAQLGREVVSRALVAHGLLSVTRRRIPRPIIRRIRAKIM
jgi:hypothetical protein